MEERRKKSSPLYKDPESDSTPDTTSSSAIANAEREKERREEKEKEEREERLKGFLRAQEREAEEKGEDFTPEDVKDNIAIFEANELATSLEETVASLANIESAKDEAKTKTIAALESDSRLVPISGRTDGFALTYDDTNGVIWAQSVLPDPTTEGYVMKVFKDTADGDTLKWKAEPFTWT